MRIGVYSTVELFFPPSKHGHIVTLITEITNKPKNKEYLLKLEDYCVVEEEVQESKLVPNEEDPMGEPKLITETTKVLNILGKLNRFNTFKYSELDFLANNLSINRSDFSSETEFINRMFQIGLLVVTQQECVNNLSGLGTGLYFSKVHQWAILTDDKFVTL